MNVLSELTVGTIALESLGMEADRLNDAVSPLIVTRDQLEPNSIGLLFLQEWEWREASERYEEADQSTIERLADLIEEEPLEFLDAVPGREGRLILPSDASAELSLTLFHFSEDQGEILLDSGSISLEGVEPFGLGGRMEQILRAPRDWLNLRRRRDCRPKAEDLACRLERCQGECRRYKKSDENRTRLVCACIF
jgi:hypothetical protein